MTPSSAQPPSTTPNATAPATGADAAHDFDFLAGRWTVHHERLRSRLQGCTEWERFTGRCIHQALPGGVANVDTNDAEAWRPGWVGMSWRIYNPLTRLWSIHWVTNEGGGLRPDGTLEPPVVGRFDGALGVFEGDDTHDGRPVRVRFRWTVQGPDDARWEQAFSADDGRSWEVNWVMRFERQAPTPHGDAIDAASPTELVRASAIGFLPEVVELRQYTLHTGQRDTLIELFDRAFVESQEAVGLAVLGQFRDLDAPQRFVWLRGFATLDSRPQALSAFYDGPVWQRHRQRANATMVEFDDVRLLRPAWPGAGWDPRGAQRPAGEVRTHLPGLVALQLLPLRQPADAALVERCRTRLADALAAHAGALQACYVSEPADNNYPRLPVRTDGPVMVWTAGFADAQAHGRFAASGTWQALQEALAPWCAGPVQTLRLVPTARSAWRA